MVSYDEAVHELMHSAQTFSERINEEPNFEKARKAMEGAKLKCENIRHAFRLHLNSHEETTAATSD